MKTQHTQTGLVKAWLWSGIALILLMVLVGGITRLTGSGLSMVEWKPVTGILPPLNEKAWQQAFDDYKQFPEYQQINFHLTLQQFKGIYWWEYLHRLLGRITGLAFLLPFLYFYHTKQLSRKLLHRLLLLMCLGGLQGLMGWVMVKSGLHDLPHVSHYRLAAHLSLALLLIACLLWTLLELEEEKPAVTLPPTPRFWYSLTQVLLLLIFCQIVLGAFVAGLKAGLSYNTFPRMGEGFFPYMAYTSPLDLLESGPVVQFLHRWFGFVVLAFACFVVYQIKCWKKDETASGSLVALRHTGNLLLLVLGLQLTLGLLTLLLQVPLVLGVLHQLVAVLLFSLSVRLLYMSRKLSNTAAIVHH